MLSAICRLIKCYIIGCHFDGRTFWYDLRPRQLCVWSLWPRGPPTAAIDVSDGHRGKGDQTQQYTTPGCLTIQPQLKQFCDVDRVQLAARTLSVAGGCAQTILRWAIIMCKVSKWSVLTTAGMTGEHGDNYSIKNKTLTGLLRNCATWRD